jgi:hypothetical protein
MPEPPFDVAVRVQLPQRGVYQSKEIARGIVDGPGGQPVDAGLAVQHSVASEGGGITEGPAELAVSVGDRIFVVDITDLLERIANAYLRPDDDPPRVLKLERNPQNPDA